MNYCQTGNNAQQPNVKIARKSLRKSSTAKDWRCPGEKFQEKMIEGIIFQVFVVPFQNMSLDNDVSLPTCV